MSEWRVAWVVLGALLLLALYPFSAWSLALAAPPWLAGALLLWTAPGSRAVTAIGDAAQTRLARVALIMIAALLLLIGWALGALGALLATTWAAALLLLSGYRSADAVRSATVGAAMAGLVVVAGVAAAEWMLARPRVADMVGTPVARERWERSYDSLWTRNVLGIRSAYERVARRRGVRRVIALGDSFTWGDKLASVDSAWPAQLERRLATDGTPTEVVNLAQRGWTTANEAEMLRRLGWQFEPDLVVWQFFVNDPYPSGADFARDGEQWRRLLPARLRQGPAGASAILYLLERTYNTALRGTDAAGVYAPLYQPESEGWRQFTAALADAADSATGRKVPIVFVLWPAYVPGTWTAETYPLRSQYAQVAQAARAAGLHVLDLTPVVAATGGDWRRWWALPWDSHPNAEAHGNAADAIARFVRDSVLIAEGASVPAPRSE